MNKRDFLKASSGLLAAGAALAAGGARAAEADSCGRVANPKTFVLVHGAFGGGYYYTPMAEILRRRGHTVFVPTLTGLGERSHLIGPDVDMTTHITDVLNVFKYEKLDDVVLVGHSYGGGVITAVAAEIPESIRSLVYFDAVIPQNGKSFGDVAGFTEQAKQLAAEGKYELPSGNGGPVHPLGTILEVMQFSDAWLDVPKKTYVWATQSELPLGEQTYDRLKGQDGWITKTIDAGHGFPASEPQASADLAEAAI